MSNTNNNHYEEVKELAKDEEEAQTDGGIGETSLNIDPKPAKKEAEEQRERQARKISSVRQIAQHNEERLENIFSDFHPDDPPNDYGEFREELTRIELVAAVHVAVGGVTHHRSVKYDSDLPRHRGGVDREWIAVREDREEQERPEVAKQAINLLASYGKDAERELSSLGASGNLPEEFQQLALEKLQEVRQEERKRPETFREAIIRRISGE